MSSSVQVADGGLSVEFELDCGGCSIATGVLDLLGAFMISSFGICSCLFDFINGIL